jgi:hypothetical protein
MVKPTWEDRDLPVLRAVLEITEEAHRTDASAQAIEEQTGFDGETVQGGLRALALADPPFFAKVDRRFVAGVDRVWGPTERARRAVGLWPTPDDLADRVIAAFDEAADSAESEERRGAFRRLATMARETGRAVLVEAMAKALERSIGI